MKFKKLEHIFYSLKKESQFNSTAGFERYEFEHNALAEINKEEIDLSTRFLGKNISAPIIISAMTGGTWLSKRINRNLAKAASMLNIPFTLGSQRIMVKKPSTINSFDMKKIAHGVFLIGNIGAVQFNDGFGVKECENIIKNVNADALTLHLNPLQEAIQRGGDCNFKGLLKKIKQINKELSVPLIIKEVGCGISAKAARKIAKTGVKIIDVAGKGGTSFARIECLRNKNRFGEIFSEWGIPTADSIINVRNATNLEIIASGGIRNGIDMAKAIAMGASLVGIAGPLLKAAIISEKKVIGVLNRLIEELKIAMFCVGAKNLKELNKQNLKMKL